MPLPGDIAISRGGLYTAFAIFVIISAGLLLRIYEIRELPVGLWYDEADNIVTAAKYHVNPGSTPVFSPSTNLPTLFLIPISFLQEVFGNDYILGRIVSAVASIFFIVSMYYLGSIYGGVFTGLVACFFTCVIKWSINWGRIGMHGITAALFATICGYFLVKAVTRWSNYWFFWCGLILGLGMWFYAAFRLFPLVVLVFFVIAVVISKPHWKLVISSLLAISYGALIGSAPLIQYAVTNQEEFFKILKQTDNENHGTNKF